MPFAPSNGVELCYETFGDPTHPALLLVMGFTAQMTVWDEAFCQQLADRGRFVIRFDNRDVGLSTKLDGQPVDIGDLMAMAFGGPAVQVPYGLEAFADDAFGLLDHLGVERAHIVGASMGGMIVQVMALRRPERVLTLTSIMSCPGQPESKPETQAALLAPPATTRDEAMKRGVEMGRIISSPRYFDADKAARNAGANYDRSNYPEGVARQLAAIVTAPDRTEALRTLAVPTLVIHGRADTLILPSGGEATAAAIPGANLLLMNDMAHDLPEPLWPLTIGAIITHTTHAIG